MNDYDEIGFSAATSPFDFDEEPKAELEHWSYDRMVFARRDSKGRFVTNKNKRVKKSCSLPKSIVSSVFFRSIIYNIDVMIDTAERVLEFRKRDLDEFNHYVEDEQVKDDPKYKQELAREIVFWTKTLTLYQTIKENSSSWHKEGKFPWSGVKVFTPYFKVPSLMLSKSYSESVQDNEMTPVEFCKGLNDTELTPVDKE